MKAKTGHGEIIRGILYKRGKSVVKFWKYSGYAIPAIELQGIKGVKLYTKYDGNLYATKETFNKHGLIHMFGDEQQIVLPTEFWEVL